MQGRVKGSKVDLPVFICNITTFSKIVPMVSEIYLKNEWLQGQKFSTIFLHLQDCDKSVCYFSFTYGYHLP